MKGYATSGDSKTVHIRKWLTDNCFGDYYTRGGLDYKQREMITFISSPKIATCACSPFSKRLVLGSF